MKITKANLEKLHKALGLQDVQVVDDEKEADEFNEETIINNFLQPKEQIFRQKWDSEVLPEKLKAEAGKFGGILKNNIKKLSNGNIKASDLEGKTDEESLQIFVEFLQKDKDTSTDGLRQQIKELAESNSAELEKLKNDYEGKLSQKDKETNDIFIENYLGDLVGQIPLIGDDNKAKISVLKNAIESQYSPVWNREKKDLELREKENPERFAMLDQNTILNTKSFAENMFKGLGMIKTDMSNERATDHVDTGNQNQQHQTQQQQSTGLGFQAFEEAFNKSSN
ncbi:hypothetical protein ACFQO9_11330 [Chryseobacterium zhengzhouense]|uniref:DUF4355 domain-containing protein n=1 Tax=Chryseobacterium zhengzhouense TaxID=1636086 RepID=A0ABW2LXK1_9FLAO